MGFFRPKLVYRFMKTYLHLLRDKHMDINILEHEHDMGWTFIVWFN